jgi:hypothetical protein
MNVTLMLHESQKVVPAIQAVAVAAKIGNREVFD